MLQTFDLSLPKTLLSFVDNKSGAYDILRLDRRGRWGTDSEGKKRFPSATWLGIPLKLLLDFPECASW